MNSKIYLSILLFLFIFSCFSQNTEFKSIHQEESEYYKQFGDDYDWSLIRGSFKPNGRQTSKACNLNKIVFGWHPYWSNGLEANYDWSLISDLSYFSYEVDPATGNPARERIAACARRPHISFWRVAIRPFLAEIHHRAQTCFAFLPQPLLSLPTERAVMALRGPCSS